MNLLFLSLYYIMLALFDNFHSISYHFDILYHFDLLSHYSNLIFLLYSIILAFINLIIDMLFYNDLLLLTFFL